jgi:hypothetical protein
MYEYDTRRRQDQNCFLRGGDYRNKGHKPEKFMGLSSGEDVGFRDNFFL